MAELKRVLSIQSHVVHGYVGNRAATFPLQLLGWDVDVINTCHLSNHTGYGSFRGKKTSAEDISEVYEGLKDIGFEYDAFLTGYAPTAEAVEAIGKIGLDIRERFPNSMWLLDPVMGDEGKLYVSESVIPEYKKILKTGKVSLITPNAFEAEILTGIKIDSVETAKQAIAALHSEYNIPNVVLSSVTLPSSDSYLYSFGSAGSSVLYFEYPVLNGYFTGTGDLFAALLLDKFHKYTYAFPDSQETIRKGPAHSDAAVVLANALRDVLAIMHGVLSQTLSFSQTHNGSTVGVLGDAESMKSLELQLVRSKEVILESSPSVIYAPTYLN